MAFSTRARTGLAGVHRRARISSQDPTVTAHPHERRRIAAACRRPFEIADLADDAALSTRQAAGALGVSVMVLESWRVRQPDRLPYRKLTARRANGISSSSFHNGEFCERTTQCQC